MLTEGRIDIKAALQTPLNNLADVQDLHAVLRLNVPFSRLADATRQRPRADVHVELNITYRVKQAVYSCKRICLFTEVV